MHEQMKELEHKVDNHERMFTSIEKTLEKLADNQSKLVSLENDMKLIKSELEHRADLYEGKLKGVKELSDKEDTQIRKDMHTLSEDIHDIKGSLKQVVFGLLGLIGTVIATLVLTQIGVK